MASAPVALQQAAVRPGEGLRAGDDGDRDAVRDRRLAEESGHDLRELVALAKAKPGSLQLRLERTRLVAAPVRRDVQAASAGIEIVHIPYRGDAPMITALIAGDIQLAFLPQATGIAQRPEQPDPRARRHRHQADGRRCPTCRPRWSRASRASRSAAGTAMFVPAGTPPDIVQTHPADARQGARRSAGARAPRVDGPGAGRQLAGGVRRPSSRPTSRASPRSSSRRRFRSWIESAERTTAARCRRP